MSAIACIEIKKMTKEQNYIRGYNDGRADATRWIPVSERLPETDDEVLVYFEYYRYGDYNRMFSTYGIGWEIDGCWHVDGYGKINVFAWMPLPEPYREEKK